MVDFLVFELYLNYRCFLKSGLPLTMSSEMDSRQLAVYNDKNQFVLALAIDTWVNLASSNFSCGQWDIY